MTRAPIAPRFPATKLGSADEEPHMGDGGFLGRGEPQRTQTQPEVRVRYQEHHAPPDEEQQGD